MTNHTDLLCRALEVCYHADVRLFVDPSELMGLISDLRTAIETGGWLPIGEAKKDGKEYLFYEDGGCFVGSWLVDKWVETVTCYPINPTHWMPLPPPPNSPSE